MKMTAFATGWAIALALLYLGVGMWGTSELVNALDPGTAPATYVLVPSIFGILCFAGVLVSLREAAMGFHLLGVRRSQR